MKNGETPDSSVTQNLVKMLQNHISENYYLCTKEILAGLGQMYVLDERFNEKNYNGPESWVDCQNRVKNGILDVIKKHDNSETIVIVTSGVNVASFINLAYGIEASENTPFLALSMCCPIMFNIDKEKLNLG